MDQPTKGEYRASPTSKHFENRGEPIARYNRARIDFVLSTSCSWWRSVDLQTRTYMISGLFYRMCTETEHRHKQLKMVRFLRLRCLRLPRDGTPRFNQMPLVCARSTSRREGAVRVCMQKLPVPSTKVLNAFESNCTEVVFEITPSQPPK